MTQYVIGVLVASRERHNDPLFKRLRNTTRSFSNSAINGIRLVEIRIVGVKNDGFALIKLAQKGARMSLIPPLSHSRRIRYGFFLFRIEKDLKMVGFE